MLTIQELRSLSKKELQVELEKARKEMLKIRISLKTKHEKDTSKASKNKADIARIMTALNEIEKGVKPVVAKKAVAEKPVKSETKKS